jgi:hypothetical protein
MPCCAAISICSEPTSRGDKAFSGKVESGFPSENATTQRC